jgi:PAS domain S-box-containing protein
MNSHILDADRAKVYQHLPVPTYVWRVIGAELIMVDFNQAAVNFSSPALKVLLKCSAATIFSDTPTLVAAMDECRRTKQSVGVELDMALRMTGELKHLKFTLTWLDPDILLLHVQDFTAAQKCTQLLELQVAQRTEALSRTNRQLTATVEKIKASKKFYNQIFDSIQEGVCVLDLQMNVIKVNSTMRRWFDLQPGFAGKKCYQLFRCSRDCVCAQCPAQKTLHDQFAHLAVMEDYRPADDKHWFEVFTFPIFDRSQVMTGIIEFVRDITERKNADQIRLDNEIKYRTLLNSQQDAIFLHKLQPEGFSAFSEVNLKAIERYGYTRDEFLKLCAADITCKDDVAVHSSAKERQSLLENGHALMFSTHIKKNGETFPVEISANIVDLQGEKYILSLARDITERKQAELERVELEMQLRQKYKMEAVGLLAGGIAHNFNNNLSIILGTIELAQFNQNSDDSSNELLDNAKIAVLRSRDLVRQILSYSRKSEQVRQPVALDQILDETIMLLRSTIPSTICFKVVIESCVHQVTIDADPSQMQEILINLCNNAMHAMDEQGTLRIDLSLKELQLKQLPRTGTFAPGKYVCICIADDGCGMTPEVQAKIFDPFFTTKPAPVGTGMGLATVQGIVAQYGGFIEVTSQLGVGSEFCIFFPVGADGDAVVVPAELEHMPGANGLERILYVDDDESLAQVSAKILRGAGYVVTVMTNSSDALKLFQADQQAFDLVITDQTMPEICGKELIRYMLGCRPDLATILYTGYSSKVDELSALRCGAKAFMLKPLQISELLSTVRRVLDVTKPEQGG